MIQRKKVLEILLKEEFCKCGEGHLEEDHWFNPDDCGCKKCGNMHCNEKLNYPLIRALSEIRQLPRVKKVWGVVEFERRYEK